ncbi:asparaginase [Leucobacter celer]|uniref:asparaginase n=1 Tax=Leucobacter celer TaxID=668625 RepID=UPI0006A79C31|nr:asparaginase [Leucobacter celer]
MAKIVVLGTGGTIASRERGGAGATATLSIADIASTLDIGTDVRDVMTIGSYRLTLGQMRTIATAAISAAAEDDVAGVVVTHGTDTIEETAYLAALSHRGAAPIVFTGAQFAADQPSPDGHRNLRDAVEFARSPLLRGAGVGIAFGGELHSARGTRKMHSTHPQPFRGGVLLARRSGDGVSLHASARPEPIVLQPDERLDLVVVDMVMSYPGADTMLFAAAAARADAVVLVGTGAGNAGPGFAESVAEATASGTPVILASRTFDGPVTPIYGNGGGVDLVRAGAISAGELSPPQARILAAVLLATDPGPDRSPFPERFARHAS